jgi:hypothetical protein
MSLSNGAKTFISTSIITTGVVWYIHWSENEARRKMKLGPQRDRLLFDEKVSILFKSKMAELEEEEDGTTA